jgi:hypothetical protein
MAAHASGLKQFWKEKKTRIRKYDHYFVKSQRSVYNVRYVFTTVTVSAPEKCQTKIVTPEHMVIGVASL